MGDFDEPAGVHDARAVPQTIVVPGASGRLRGITTGRTHARCLVQHNAEPALAETDRREAAGRARTRVGHARGLHDADVMHRPNNATAASAELRGALTKERC